MNMGLLDLTITGVNRPGKESTQVLNDIIQSIQSKIKGKTCILGDFNAHHTDYNAKFTNSRGACVR